MKAFALESSDRPARIIDIAKPEVGEADVLVAVKAASVNGIDVYQAMGARNSIVSSSTGFHPRAGAESGLACVIRRLRNTRLVALQDVALR
jgi:NADPH:quinone reductase-like Zn-dependent oxidoreductase